MPTKIELLVVIFTLIAFVLLVPGLTQPIFSVQVKTNVDAGIAKFTADNLDKTNSIFGTIKELHESKNTFVAFLILFFSILIPLFKGTAVIFSIFLAKKEVKEKIIRVIDIVGKWSMADVFVVAIFLAYLSTRNQVNSQTFGLSAFGMQLPVRVDSLMSSSLGPGFYFFLGYCLLSLCSVYILRRKSVCKL